MYRVYLKMTISQIWQKCHLAPCCTNGTINYYPKR